MKKLLTLFLSALFLFSLVSCSHRHTVESWSLNQHMHWHVCTECEKKTDATPHEFRSNGICIVCNASVEQNSNGSYTVTVYDSNGKIRLKEYVFDADGNILNETVFQSDSASDGFINF